MFVCVVLYTRLFSARLPSDLRIFVWHVNQSGPTCPSRRCGFWSDKVRRWYIKSTAAFFKILHSASQVGSQIRGLIENKMGGGGEKKGGKLCFVPEVCMFPFFHKKCKGHPIRDEPQSTTSDTMTEQEDLWASGGYFTLLAVAFGLNGHSVLPPGSGGPLWWLDLW